MRTNYQPRVHACRHIGLTSAREGDNPSQPASQRKNQAWFGVERRKNFASRGQPGSKLGHGGETGVIEWYDK